MNGLRRLDGAWVGALVGLVALLGVSTLDLFWTYDDPFLLRWAEEHSALQAFTDPEVTRELPFGLVTPLLFASYELDLAWFGREAAFFYGHQLVALALAVSLLYLVLRLWLHPAFAGFAALVFLIGPPTTSWFLQLMTRHYVEGLAWASLAVLGFVLGLRNDRWIGQIPAATATALALCAKEVYVPLPLLLLCLPEGSFRDRFRHLAPHAVVLAVYPVWRFMLLGTLVGGYGWVSGVGGLRHLPGDLVREMVGPAPAWGLAAAVSVALLAILGVWGRRSGQGLLWVAFLVVLMPLAPAADSIEPRLAVLPWTVLAVAAAFGLHRLSTRWTSVVAAALAAGVVLLLLPAHRATWTAEYAEAERMSLEARVFLEELDSGDLLAWPATPPGTLAELARRRRHLGRSAATWFTDDLYLCLHRRLPPRVVSWRSEAEAVVDVTGEMNRRRERFCDSLRERAPLRAELAHADGTLSWRLGPWRDGRWFLVTGDGRNRYEVPREGAFYLGDAERLRPRVRFDSPEGWTTYSPELVFDFDRESLVWER